MAGGSPPTNHSLRGGRGTAALAGTLPTPTIAQSERLQSLLKLVVRKSGRRRRCPVKQSGESSTCEEPWLAGHQ